MNMIDRTMKHAKTLNKKVVFYNESIADEFSHNQLLTYNLKKSITNNMDGFDVYYQPIANPVTGIWCGLEALCRWKSRELGCIPTSIFIAETERIGLISSLGAWVLRTAVGKCKSWGLDELKHFILDVNVSAQQFSTPAFAEAVIKTLNAFDYPGYRLCLEITESTQFTLNDTTLSTIRKLKDYGISIALDDFGTGYSSFNKLKEMPVDFVKVERIFVADIENDSYLRYLFRVIADLAHTADMKIVAEGVENQEQMKILLNSGADFLQGYLFAKPLSGEEVKRNLRFFYERDISYSLIRNQISDLAGFFSEESGYSLTPTLSKLMNKCIHILYRHENINEAVQNVIETVGVHLGISRVYVFRRDDEDIFTNTFEWCAQGIRSRIDKMQKVTVPDYWTSALLSDRIILSSGISDLPDETRASLMSYRVKSLVVLPLWDKKNMHGYIGFEDCVTQKYWWPDEIIMLINLSMMVSSLLINCSINS